ncbi:MAG TPA: HAD family hydrolase [Ktedonobacterales bacterium]|jgi:D-glycero-D-manno-heptose 1,7-bisphosphate phosphatase|nr:HAD family hydrolase [Ktedonobacterales bacterium]
MDDSSTHNAAPALFLDRDGTLTYPYHYPSRPEHLRLYPGIGEPLRTLQQAGFRLVVVTNQSGVARGFFTEADLARMHTRLQAMLWEHGVRLDAVYHCPHHPDGVVSGLSVRCDCRKPQPGMVLQAAGDLNLDLARSWFVGDILDDIEAGARAGCRTVLVDLGTEAAPLHDLRRPTFVARDTPHALAIIRGAEGLGPAPEFTYRPASWDSSAAEPTSAHQAALRTAIGGAHG